MTFVGADLGERMTEPTATAARRGVGLLPLERRTCPGVRVLPLADPEVVLTAYAVTRRGRENWSPLRLLLERLCRHHSDRPPYAASSVR